MNNQNRSYSPLWLSYTRAEDSLQKQYCRFFQTIVCTADSPILQSAERELEYALPLLTERSPVLTPCPQKNSDDFPDNSLCIARFEQLPSFWRMRIARESLPDQDGFRIVSAGNRICAASLTDRGVLYGVFALLRRMQTGLALDGIDITDKPRLAVRMLNHWDNLDGSIERGYAGPSLWKWDDLPGNTDSRYADYARLCASVGINGAVLNNVNTEPRILENGFLDKTASIASVLRRYGIKTYLSVNFGSPSSIGGLPTSDPCDPDVIQWWKDKVRDVYDRIPDFGGFLVKADSEGQPGPYKYGRTHADGANMLASVLAPYGGLLIWRAFVYGHGETDRAKKAYADFMPLDGTFLQNAVIQVKNGPIDFQPREPLHPLVGAMKHTSVFIEFQITQEYLGQGNHLVYLGPMWKEIFEFDTMRPVDGLQGGAAQVNPAHTAPASDSASVDGRPMQSHTLTAARVLESQTVSGAAAVANTGSSYDWCGSPFHPVNWYAFGRLAWDNTLDPAAVAREWTVSSWGADSAVTDAVCSILMQSHEACVDYMTPLGLNHIMKYHHHYGPDPACAEGEREDWRPRYYHRADENGLGFDRTRTGSGAVDQYAPALAEKFNSLSSCPEKYLVWFHHVPWNYKLSSGRTLIDELVFRYNRGIQTVDSFIQIWKKVQGLTDEKRYQAVLEKLSIQAADARHWRTVCVPYFQSFTKQPVNLFACYGYSQLDIDKKLDDAWNTIFNGSADERFFYENEHGGYLVDTGNNDVRTEGMSYGMMAAVQMNRKDIFDKIWSWAMKYMYMTTGPLAGYFAWTCRTDGSTDARGPAPDGEEYFALALLFASKRWGDGEGIFNYSERARKLLHDCIHSKVPMWDPSNHLIKFVPGCDFSDPSYHLPHFYDIFAQRADTADREFWVKAAQSSRDYLSIACHPSTGLAAEYAYYDGTPNSKGPPSGHGDFYSDSYRVAANIGLDAQWSGGCDTLRSIAGKILTFFDGKDTHGMKAVSIDGTPCAYDVLHPVGLTAANAQAALAVYGMPCFADAAERAVRKFWNTPLRTGERRYYDNCLYLFALLALSGRYRIW